VAGKDLKNIQAVLILSAGQAISKTISTLPVYFNLNANACSGGKTEPHGADDICTQVVKT
jgi:hypothetical protein